MRRLGLLVAMWFTACGGEEAPPVPERPAATGTTPEKAPEPPRPPQPLPQRPFGPGDTLDALEVTIEGPQSGDEAFGYMRNRAPDHLVIPLPRGCRIIRRIEIAFSMICEGNYGAVFGFYSRLTEAYVAERRRFGGRFDDFGRVGIFKPEARLTLVIDVGHGDHAPVGVRSGGIPLRIRGEPSGDFPRWPPERQTAEDPRERLLHTWGPYDCGELEVIVGTNTITFNPGDTEAECRRFRLSNGPDRAVSVVCGEITGRSDLLGERAARWQSQGISLRAAGDDIEVDGQRCTPMQMRQPTKRRSRIPPGL